MKLLITGAASEAGCLFTDSWNTEHPNDMIIGIDKSVPQSSDHVYFNKNDSNLIKSSMTRRDLDYVVNLLKHQQFTPDVIINFYNRSNNYLLDLMTAIKPLNYQGKLINILVTSNSFSVNSIKNDIERAIKGASYDQGYLISSIDFNVDRVRY